MATPVTFDELFTLESAGDDTFRAISAEYPWGQVYGGRVAAQGLAAGLTTGLVYEPHSLRVLRAYREPRRADRVRGRPRS